MLLVLEEGFMRLIYFCLVGVSVVRAEDIDRFSSNCGSGDSGL